MIEIVLPEIFINVSSYALILFAISRATRKLVIKNQNGDCGDCQEHIGNRLEIHHIIPKSRGGSNHPDNLIALCGEEFNDCHDKWDQAAQKGKMPDGRPLRKP